MRFAGWGPAGDTREELAREGEPQRETADQVLARDLGVEVRPAPASPQGAAPSPEQVVNGTTATSGSCLVFRPSGSGASVILALPPGGLVVASPGGAPVPFGARAFADAFPPTPLGTIQGATPQLIRIGTAKHPVSWHLELLPSEQLRVCPAAQ